MQKPLTNLSSNGYEWFKRNRIVCVLETVQGLFILGSDFSRLCVLAGYGDTASCSSVVATNLQWN
jgi:hypothetical protein